MTLMTRTFLAAVLVATPLAHAASYDSATGLLSLPTVSVSGSSACYKVSLRSTGSSPLTLEALSAVPTNCTSGEAAEYSPSDGRLNVQALSLQGSACFDVSLLRTSASPLRLQLVTAKPAACTIDGLARPGKPTELQAAPANNAITLSFRAPASSDGGTPTGYIASCGDGESVAVASGTASPLAVTGLVNGRAYNCSVLAFNASGNSATPNTVSATPAGAANSFNLTTSIAANGGALPRNYTCDGTGSSPDLAWTNVPAGTKEFALLMTTLPKDGGVKWNWVLYQLDGSLRALKKDSFGIGKTGVGSDGPMATYQAPCSQGPGTKFYTWTLYALSGSPQLSAATTVTGDVLTAAIAPLTLGSASLTLGYDRTDATGGATSCFNIRSSTLASTTGYANVSCDAQYAYISSLGIPTHAMMNGITATNLQVPATQNFVGANGWKIPLAPQIAATTTSAVDGPIGVAINGVPIFNPCKQGGCQNGDTKVLGELDACNGHAGRADDYHYHAAPVCVMAGRAASYWATHPIGWALDGFAIFGYQDASGNAASRDSICGGNTDAVSNGPSGYSYHVTDASPYVLSCFRGEPSPDFAGQSSKYKPMRQPPVTPFAVSNMTLTRSSDGYDELAFTSSLNFSTTETGTDRYANTPGTYKIRYRQLTGAELQTELLLAKNANRSACWMFQFTTQGGTSTQPDVTYCR
jgi:phosphatidylethanolamine-binding protein (PEBP) family uncharacterized protein